MNRHRNFQKNMPEQVEENPRGNNTGESQSDPADASEPAARPHFFLQNRGETGSAEDAAFVFGNAFAAKKAAASRTTRHGLAGGMISAALCNQFHR